MSLLSRILGRERRDATLGADGYVSEYLGNRGGMAGHVDVRRAAGLSVAHACIAAISQNLAAVPLNLYRRAENGGRTKARDHVLHCVLHDMMGEGLTAFEGREALIASLLMRGNAYAAITRNGRGQVQALRPLDPGTVSVERLRSGRLRYRVSGQGPVPEVYTQDEMLHIRYRLAPDGIMGLSPIQIAREQFSLSLTQETQARRQADRAFRPEGVLSFAQMLSMQNREQLLERLEHKVSDPSGTGGILVLDGGAQWSPLSFNSKDAEFLAHRKMSDLAVARIFAVPPTAIGITDNATYSNVDGESRALVMRCLAPMARRVEQAMNAALLSAEGRRSYFVEHDLAGLLRGDMKARYESYRIGREWGWLSPNEIRAWENLAEIEGGDEYLSPLNMTSLGEREIVEEGGDNG